MKIKEFYNNKVFPILKKITEKNSKERAILKVILIVLPLITVPVLS